MRRGPAWAAEVERLDAACYAAIAQTPTPRLDRTLAGLSRTADHSKISLGIAAGLAICGGARGRRAATSGLVSVAVTATVVNVAVKPLARRRRPDRAFHKVPVDRHVPLPSSRSFPSGHSAAAFAFAGGAGDVIPSLSPPLHALAALVAYSRVHTGVHYPLDAIAGSVLGATLSQVTRGVRRDVGS